MSSTDHIYHRATKRRGDKFDWSMTRGKLLDNNQHFSFFYFYSNNDPMDKTDDRTDSRNADSRNKLPVEWEGVAYCSCVGISDNIPNSRFVYVDLIGKKIQVIQELHIIFFKVISSFYILRS